MGSWRETEFRPESELHRRVREASQDFERPAVVDDEDASPRKPWWRRFLEERLSWVLYSVMFVVVLMIGQFYFGPRAKPPGVDPVHRLNAEADALPSNAAPLYQEALRAFRPLPADFDASDLKRVREPAFRATIEAHLTDNAACLALLAKATAVRGCRFKYFRDEKGRIDVENAMGLRDLGRLMSRKAALARVDRNAADMIQCLELLDRMSLHFLDERSPIAYLCGLATQALLQDHVLAPLEWGVFSDAEQADYAARVPAFCTPPPPLATLLDATRDQFLSVGDGGELPHAERIAGEFDEYLAPLRELAQLPVEEHIRRDHAARENLERVWSRTPHKAQLVRQLVAESVPALRLMVRLVDLRARLIAQQRGNLAAARIVAERQSTGVWPADLSGLGSVGVDLFTGRALVYTKDADSFRLYSCGFDGDDDGGRHDDRFGDPPPPKDGETPPPPDGDFVFWPPSASDAPTPSPSRP